VACCSHYALRMSDFGSQTGANTVTMDR
jgi:hypothetical protein